MSVVDASLSKKLITYEELLAHFRKGVRNGNFRRLHFVESAFYRAAMWYARHHDGIVNGLLVEKLWGLIERLRETKGMRIFKRGFEKAVEILKECEANGVLEWAPGLRDWMKDPDYIFWLGTMC